MKKIEFPIVDGVEVRDLAPTRRLLGLTFIGNAKNMNHFKLASDRLLVTDEEAQGEKVPAVLTLLLDSRIAPGCMAGTITRITADSIYTMDDSGRFDKGYMRQYDKGVMDRIVSEPFMISSVRVLTEEEFAIAVSVANATFEKNNSVPHSENSGFSN